MYRPQFFFLSELVCPKVYYKYGEKAWQFLDEKGLVILDWVRRKLNKPITVNNWYDGGDFDERGLRCNQCNIVRSKSNQGYVYMSAHVLGKAYDFDVDGMTAGEVRVWIASHKNELPYNIRLELEVEWVHMDTFDTNSKIYFFKP